MGNFEVQRNVQYICLELLLSFVNDMAARALDVCVFALISTLTTTDRSPFNRRIRVYCGRKQVVIDPYLRKVAYILQEYPSAESLLQAKSKKQLILTGASRFNSKPKSGITFLEENGLIYTDLGPETSKGRSLALFLKNCTRIDKRLLGDFISKPENLDVLKEFIGLFDFKDVSYIKCKRRYELIFLEETYC